MLFPLYPQNAKVLTTRLILTYMFMKIASLENIKFDESLAGYNTFQVGGAAKFFIEAGDKELVQKVIYAAESDGTPYMILGGGTNVLVSDKGFNGLIIKIGRAHV